MLLGILAPAALLLRCIEAFGRGERDLKPAIRAPRELRRYCRQPEEHGAHNNRPMIRGDRLRAALAAAHPVCPVITAFGSVSNAGEALRQGANDFLTRPQEMDHFLLSVDRLIAQSGHSCAATTPG